MVTTEKAAVEMHFSDYDTFAYYFTNIFCFIIIFALTFHSYNLFRFIYANLTQLERMMGY